MVELEMDKWVVEQLQILQNVTAIVHTRFLVKKGGGKGGQSGGGKGRSSWHCTQIYSTLLRLVEHWKK
jgi:hypothetical protein